MTVAESPLQTNAPLLEMRAISKSFGTHRVLRDVDFDLYAGEVHALAGENGAGKSTLMRILGGVLAADAGTIRVRRESVRFRHTRDAAAHGVAVIHQEFSLVGSMSVADNLFLGREPSRLGWISRASAIRRTEELARRVGLHLDPHQRVGTLPISSQQLIEIAKALALEARILVMDEPTSALSEPEVRNLFERIAHLKSQGCGIIYITHRLEEIYSIADRISVLRDGSLVTTESVAKLPAETLVRLMVGRTISDQVPSRTTGSTDVFLKVEHCTVHSSQPGRPPVVRDVSIDVRRGEILGIVGLEDSGISDLLLAIFGAFGRRAMCQVHLNGKRLHIASPRDAIRHGIALVTNDRKQTGLVLPMDIVENASLAALPRLSPRGWLHHRAERALAATSAQQLNLRAASLNQTVSTLSGGNQQKVVLAKWMATNPEVLLLDEPTRGVDVGAKHEIYLLMNEWSSRGRSILLSSSEWPELLQVSDRIMVMHRGRAVAIFDATAATPADLLRASMGLLNNG